MTNLENVAFGVLEAWLAHLLMVTRGTMSHYSIKEVCAWA